jgi:glucokinase
MPPRRVIGIDAGGTKLLGGVVDEQMVVHHRVRRTWRGAGRQETLDVFTDAVEEARAAAPDVEAVGLGIPALVEWEAGVSRWSNHLPLDGVPFRDLMSERLGVPVVVDNDGNASMLAEARAGAAAGARHAVMVSLGTGIGGGLWLNGELYRGATGLAGELGHVVLQLHGPDCPGDCPGVGCFEALVSGNTIGREGLSVAEREPDSALGRRLTSGKAIDGGIVTEMAHDGDPLAREVLATIGERLGYGLVGLVNTFNPEVIVIGGGAARGGELLLGPAREVIAARALPPARERVRVLPAHYGDEAGMMGAALMALEARS